MRASEEAREGAERVRATRWQLVPLIVERR